MVAVAPEDFEVVLELVAERTDIVVQGSEHTAAEQRNSGPGMGLMILETFLACPRLWCPSWSS